jgi:hypothetical protein
MILLVSLLSKNTTPTAWMIAVRISFPIPVPFLGWITSAEHYWITFAARRSAAVRHLDGEGGDPGAQLVVGRLAPARLLLSRRTNSDTMPPGYSVNSGATHSGGGNRQPSGSGSALCFRAMLWHPSRSGFLGSLGFLPVIAEKRSANSKRIALSASWMVPASHRTKCRPKP